MWPMFQRRVEQYQQLAEFLYENRHELIHKQKEHNHSFHEDPEHYMPYDLYKDMSTGLVDKINEFLDMLVHCGGRMNKSDILGVLLPY